MWPYGGRTRWFSGSIDLAPSAASLLQISSQSTAMVQQVNCKLLYPRLRRLQDMKPIVVRANIFIKYFTGALGSESRTPAIYNSPVVLHSSTSCFMRFLDAWHFRLSPCSFWTFSWLRSSSVFSFWCWIKLSEWSDCSFSSWSTVSWWRSIRAWCFSNRTPCFVPSLSFNLVRQLWCSSTVCRYRSLSCCWDLVYFCSSKSISSVHRLLCSEINTKYPDIQPIPSITTHRSTILGVVLTVSLLLLLLILSGGFDEVLASFFFLVFVSIDVIVRFVQGRD